MSTTQQHCSQKELALTLTFIENCGVEKLEKPTKVLAEKVMLDQLGWPITNGTASSAYKRARRAILALEASGKITCLRSPHKRLVTVQKKKTDPDIKTIRSEKTLAIEETLPTTRPELPESAEKLATKKRLQERMLIARFLKSGGQAQRNAEKKRRGNNNEQWLHTSLLKLTKVLIKLHPELVLNGRCHRSGRHDPKRGKVDLQDHWGEDDRFYLTTTPTNPPPKTL